MREKKNPLTTQIIPSILITIISISCSNNPYKGKSTGHQNEQSSDHGKKLFSLVDSTTTENDQQKDTLIAINKYVLDKELLLRSNVIEGGESPTFHSLKSRIVLFSMQDNALLLKESPKGHIYQNDIHQSLLITKFEIYKETEDQIIFDYNQGMTNIFTMNDWYVSDFSGKKHPDLNSQFHSVKVKHSYLDKITVVNNKAIQINQVSQVELAPNTCSPVEIRYLLEEYKENKNFKPTRTDKEKDTKYFEVSPQITKDTEEHQVFASKFDITKPVVFSISHNTPDEYKDSIKEGVLYWNKALGENVIQVIDAPPGVTAPSYDYNMIQWIDWKNAGYAYADAQMNPRTGEILNAQIYLTSTFAINSRRKARSILSKASKIALTNKGMNFPEDIQQLINNKWDFTPPESQKEIGLKTFEHNHLCHYDAYAAYITSLHRLISNEATDSKFLEISKHYIRDVVAHEVGHTLGLRHNFAGALHSNIDFDKKKTMSLVTSSIKDSCQKERKPRVQSWTI